MDQAIQLDAQSETYRDLFEFPTLKSMGLPSPSSDQCIYLCGNSLGLMPIQTRKYINDELSAWAARGVESHFRNEITHNWVDVDLPLIPQLANLVGALNNEVAPMGTLTMNLNSLLIPFYNPVGKRTKILFEKGAFPSDYYAFFNLVKLKGLDPNVELLQLSPREGEYNLRTEDILNCIEQNGEQIALICFSGIQYYSGQLFNIKDITKKGHDYGCVVGWDLAHAAGNIDLKLHDWNVDFAVWCNYKYINSGPGAIGGIFVNEIHCSNDSEMPRLAGWWGNNSEMRFQMLEKFQPIKSALGFRQSNPSVLDIAALKSSLDIFSKAGGIEKLRVKSIKLTSFLETHLKSSKFYKTIDESNTYDVEQCEPHFIIITPSNPMERGAQLSLLFKPGFVMLKIFDYLNQHGIICDERRPNVIRLAPTPLYNTFEDCIKCVQMMETAFNELLQ